VFDDLKKIGLNIKWELIEDKSLFAIK